MCGDGGGEAGPSIAMPGSPSLSGRRSRVASITAIRRCNKGRRGVLAPHKDAAPHPHSKRTSCFPHSPGKCPPQTNSRVPVSPQTLGFCSQEKEGRIHVLVCGLPAYRQQPIPLESWSSLCYLGESQPPPSSDAISRTAAQNHTQTRQHHIYAHRHIQSSQRQAGGCPPCFHLFLSTILLEDPPGPE